MKKFTVDYMCGPVHSKTVEAEDAKQARQLVSDEVCPYLCDEDGFRVISVQDEDGVGYDEEE